MHQDHWPDPRPTVSLFKNLCLTYSWPKKPYLGWYLNIGGNVIIHVSLLVPQAKLSGSSLHCVCHSDMFNFLWAPGSSVHGILRARILEWGATPFSRGSSQPRDQTHISCIAGRFFIIWATKEAHSLHYFFFYLKPSDVNIFISFASVPSGYISPRNLLGHMKIYWVPSPVILKF